MPEIALDGFSMHYEQAGQGFPLLLIPGALGTGAGDFHAQIDWFAPYFTVIAPDPRGYGRSRPPERDFPTDFYHRDAADMLALMTALGHARFHLLGWSDGANIAAIMAATQPARVTRLVMFGGQSFLTAQDIAAMNAVRDISAWSPRAAAAMRAVYGGELDALWGRYVDGQAALLAAGGDLYRALLPAVRSPAFILHGAGDPLVPQCHPETIHRALAGSRFHVFPGGKHNIHVKYADAFNAMVLDFLTE